MEPVVDFGLFELAAATGAAWMARRVYSRRVLAVVFLAASLIAPMVLVLISHVNFARWVAAFCLATAVVNAGLLFPLVLRNKLDALVSG
jgi:hypothetical protein